MNIEPSGATLGAIVTDIDLRTLTETTFAEVEAAGQLPDDKILVPGVIDSTTHFVEHPVLIAQRIEKFAAIVGKERVMAGTDCGFSTFAGYAGIDPDIAYAKLSSLAEGASIASDRLWG